jgi:hypothetical protein
MCKNILKIFQKFEMGYTHAHPKKVVQCDIPKGVTRVCFTHPICFLFGVWL